VQGEPYREESAMAFRTRWGAAKGALIGCLVLLESLEACCICDSSDSILICIDRFLQHVCTSLAAAIG
jgi:hypothetical protein